MLGAVLAACATCSKPPAAAPPVESTPAPAGAGEGAGFTVSGHAPGAANGFSSIVVLEPVGDAKPSPQTWVPYMDQVQQTFTPPVLLVRTGQPTEFRNNDDVLHNVRVREDATKLPAFNVAIPTGEKFVYTFPRDGFYDVGCDIHPGMFAQIVSTSSPYATIADPDGSFVLEDVPPGQYKAIAYGAGREIVRPVQVGAGHTEFDLRQ